MDDDRRIRELREGLDRELSSVGATAEARRELLHAAAEQTPPGAFRRPAARWAVPLAVAAAVAGVAVLPSALRSGEDATPAPQGIPPAVSPGPSGPDLPAPPVSGTPTPRGTTNDPAPSATRSVDPRALPSATTGAQAAGLVVTPASVVPGQVVSVVDAAGTLKRGEASVSWGDGTSTARECRSSAATTPATAAVEAVLPLTHSYRQAGVYTLTVTLDPCGAATPQRLVVRVVTTPAAAGTS